MQGLPDMKRWNKITGMAYNKTKSKKKDELGDQVCSDGDGIAFEMPHGQGLLTLESTISPSDLRTSEAH